MHSNYVHRVNSKYLVAIDEDSAMINIAREYIFHMRIIDAKRNVIVN